MGIVRNSSQLMYDVLQNSSFPYTNRPLFSGKIDTEQQNFLLDLLECILDQFRFVAFNHQSFLDSLQRIIVSKLFFKNFCSQRNQKLHILLTLKVGSIEIILFVSK